MIKPFGFVFTATDRTKAALGSVTNGMHNLLGVSRRTQEAMNANNVVVAQFGRNAQAAGRSAFAAGGGFKNLSFQIADVAVTAATMNPFLILSQQGSQLLATFGTAGAMLGAFAAIVGTVGYVAMRTGGNLDQLSGAAGVLAPIFSGIASAMSVAGNTAIDAINAIINNFDHLVIGATVVVAMMGVQWVRAFGVARLATVGLSGAMTVLRMVMLRLPFIAIAVALTEAVYWFLRLVEGAGSVGRAFSLLYDVGKEAMGRLGDVGEAMGARLMQVAAKIKLAFLNAFTWVHEQAINVTQRIANITPDFLDDGLQERLAAMRVGLDELNGAVNETQANIDRYGRDADAADARVAAPLDSWRAIQDVLDNVNRSQVDVRDLFGEAGDAAKKAGRVAKDAVDTFDKVTVDFVKSVRGIADNMTRPIDQALMDLTTATKSPVDAFRSMATDIIAELYRILVVQRLVNATANWLGGTPGSGETGVLGNILPTSTIVGNRASGGNVDAGKPYRINENYGSGKGEIFIPGQSGKISNTGGGGDGQTVIVNQNIYLSAGVAETVRREVAAAAPKIANASREAVYVARKRGKPA